MDPSALRIGESFIRLDNPAEFRGGRARTRIRVVATHQRPKCAPDRFLVSVFVDAEDDVIVHGTHAPPTHTPPLGIRIPQLPDHESHSVNWDWPGRAALVGFGALSVQVHDRHPVLQMLSGVVSRKSLLRRPTASSRGS